jgi:hypothetical protein
MTKDLSLAVPFSPAMVFAPSIFIGALCSTCPFMSASRKVKLSNLRSKIAYAEMAATAAIPPATLDEAGRVETVERARPVLSILVDYAMPDWWDVPDERTATRAAGIGKHGYFGCI